MGRLRVLVLLLLLCGANAKHGCADLLRLQGDTYGIYKIKEYQFGMYDVCEWDVGFKGLFFISTAYLCM